MSIMGIIQYNRKRTLIWEKGDTMEQFLCHLRAQKGKVYDYCTDLCCLYCVHFQENDCGCDELPPETCAFSEKIKEADLSK